MFSIAPMFSMRPRLARVFSFDPEEIFGSIPRYDRDIFPIDVADDKEHWKTSIPAGDFSPDDVKVKVRGNHLIVHAEYESRDGNNGHYEHREMQRVIQLPEDVKTDQIKARVSDGCITITGPKLPALTHQEAKPESVEGGSSDDTGAGMKDEQMETSNKQVATTGEKPLEYKFNMASYSPENVRVKVRGRTVTIHAEQQRDDDCSNYQMFFERSFTLPESADTNTVKCKLGSDGMLIISVPCCQPVEDEEKHIAIELMS